VEVKNMMTYLLQKSMRLLLLPLLLFLAACSSNTIVINDIGEREANEIVVFLASHNIPATKIASSAAGPGGGTSSALMFNISVDSTQATDAMALLNQNGLPRIKGTSLLELFAKSGLMSSDKEETIRFQAGLGEQIAGMIRQIDGIIEAQVQLAFPPEQTGIAAAGPAQQRKVTASVYVKHQGVLDDPNSHLITKIKRLVSASVAGLDINDVTVIPDRARFAEISLGTTPEALSAQQKDYVSIWSIVMNKQSAGKFRFLFFTLTFAFLIFALMSAWLIWKFYPILRKEGFRQLFNPKPIEKNDHPPSEEE
jgi:type III secretion protein J